MRLLLLIALMIGCLGCSQQPDLVYLPDAVQPVPTADLPVDMRVKNWTGRGKLGNGGSCVHASTQNVFQAIGRPDLVDVWRKNRRRGYQGPETGSGILSKYREQNIPYVYTETGDVELLEKATETHRPGIIFYYPSHCVNFIEFRNTPDGEKAVLLDNNFPDRYIVIDRDVFERSWKYYDGFAAVPWLEDRVLPRTFPRTMPRI